MDNMFANVAPRNLSPRHYGDFPFGGHDVSHWGVRAGWWQCRDGIYRHVLARMSSSHWQHWVGRDGNGRMEWGDWGNYVPQPQGATPHPFDLIEFVGLDCGGSGLQWRPGARIVSCRCNRCQEVE
ncbi:MAG: hypothetical protein ACK528_05030 [Alphaproteobacteria bacterium]|jgi:hypothetical protein